VIEIKQKFELEHEAVAALKYRSYFNVIWELDEFLRDELKHKNAGKETEMIREKLVEIMFSNDASFTDIL
jgi:hypothetical protein